MRTYPVRPCPRCLAEVPGRILTWDVNGWYHSCSRDMWLAAGGPQRDRLIEVPGDGPQAADRPPARPEMPTPPGEAVLDRRAVWALVVVLAVMAWLTFGIALVVAGLRS